MTTKKLKYVCIPGQFYNINAFGSIVGMSGHGVNSEINYIGIRFPKYSRMEKGFESMPLSPDDYLLIELILPKTDFVDRCNLVNFTPYFYSYQTQDVLASVNQTITMFSGSSLKVCCTSSTHVGTKYSKQGYTVLYLPVEYLGDASFCPIVRLGVVHTDHFLKVPSTFTANYYSTTTKTDYTASKSSEYTTTFDIIKTLPVQPFPTPSSSHLTLSSQYKSITNLFSKYMKYKTYPYLSNFYGVNYAFQSFYDSITVSPYVNMQLNNTQENYFSSQTINVSSNNKYFYIVSVNQRMSGCGLISNVQIYDKTNLMSVLTLKTSPILPPLSEKTYPYANTRDCHDRSFYCLEIPESYLYNSNILEIIIIERIGYNASNYNSTNYSYPNSTTVFYGDRVVDMQVFSGYDVSMLNVQEDTDPIESSMNGLSIGDTMQTDSIESHTPTKSSDTFTTKGLSAYVPEDIN